MIIVAEIELRRGVRSVVYLDQTNSSNSFPLYGMQYKMSM